MSANHQPVCLCAPTHPSACLSICLPACLTNTTTHPHTQVTDPYWEDVSSYGYQALQPHQDLVIQAAEQQVDRLRTAATAARSRRSSSNGSGSVLSARKDADKKQPQKQPQQQPLPHGQAAASGC